MRRTLTFYHDPRRVSRYVPHRGERERARRRNRPLRVGTKIVIAEFEGTPEQTGIITGHEDELYVVQLSEKSSEECGVCVVEVPKELVREASRATL